MTNIARHAASSHASFSVTMHIMRNTAEEGRFYQMSGKKTPTAFKVFSPSSAYQLCCIRGKLGHAPVTL